MVANGKQFYNIRSLFRHVDHDTTLCSLVIN